jgi:signal transduction histidine kinase
MRASPIISSLVTVFLLLLFVCPIALGQGEYDARSVMVWKQARQAQLDYVNQLKQQLASDPENRALLLNLGRSYYWLAVDRDSAAQFEAEKTFEQVLARDPAEPTALVYHGALLGLKIGLNLVSLDQFPPVMKRSFEEMDRAVELAPDDAEVRQIRAYASFHTPSFLGRDQLAIEDFNHVLRQVEQTSAGDYWRAEIYLVLGDTYNKIGDQARARQSWEQAARLVPESRAALAAEARLRSPGATPAASEVSVKDLIALFSFFVGVIIFAILTVLVARDLVRARRRRRGMAASLIVSAAALLWTGVNLSLALMSATGISSTGGFERLAAWHRSDIYLILALSPIPFGLITAYRFYKAAFMDIALKRGAALVVIVALSIVYGRLLEVTAGFAFYQLSNSTLRLVFYTLMWLTVFSLYLPLRRRIYAAVDRYIFKRRDYSRLLDWFTDRLRSATDEATLIVIASDAIKEAFAAGSALFLPPTQEVAGRVSETFSERGADVLLRAQVEDDQLSVELENRNAELVLAVRTREGVEGVILVGARAYGQGYLSEELSVLRAVAAEIGRDMENLRLHEARRRQAIAEENLRKLVAEAELKALRAQIDPHFFFNALNSVASLIEDDPAAAEELLEDISELFRHSFRQRRDFITLGEEMALVETYLRVERVRLGDKLSFTKVVPTESLTLSIPALTIQPLVENAVKHGISRASRGGAITLSVAVKESHLEVFVADTGVGIAASELPEIFSRGVGLANVNNRLKGLYGEQSGLRIDSREGYGTTLSFVVPLAVERAKYDSGNGHR